MSLQEESRNKCGERTQLCDDIGTIFLKVVSSLPHWMASSYHLPLLRNPVSISFSRKITYFPPQVVMVVVAGVVLSGNCHWSVPCTGDFSEHFIHILHSARARTPGGITLSHVLWMKKMRSREVSSFALGHSADRWI